MKKFIFWSVVGWFALSILLLLFDGVSDLISSSISVKGSDGTEYTSYQTACSQGDFDAAREFIGKMKSSSYYNKRKNKDAVVEAEDYVFNEEIQYLASLNDEQASNRVISLLNHQKIDGVEVPDGTLIAYNVEEGIINDYYYLNKDIEKYHKFIEWSRNHNSRCISILSTAISSGNQSLAKKILNSFRKDPDMLLKNKHKEREDSEYYYYDVYAHYTNSSIDAAKKKYDEAVKSGAFE